MSDFINGFVLGLMSGAVLVAGLAVVLLLTIERNIER
jgi:hypothetical protein